MTTKTKVTTFSDVNFFAQNEVKAKKRSSPALTLGHENIGGMLPDYWGGYIPPWICTHGYERFEIIEELYLSKALLKMAGGGMHPPHLPPGSAPGPWYATKCLFASFATAIFRKICRGPSWPKA